MRKLRNIFISYLICFFFVVPAQASPYRVQISSTNSDEFGAVSALNQLNLSGGCHFFSGNRFRVGTFRNKGQVFRTTIRRDIRKALKDRGVPAGNNRRNRIRDFRRQLNTQCAQLAAKRPSSSPAPAPAQDIPQLANWESQMKQFGRTHCENLSRSNLSFDFKLASTYYDSQWVFFQIADYTKDSYWRNCAQAAERIYRDQYAKNAGWLVPGFWIFTHGLAQDYLRTGDTASRTAAIEISRNAAFARDSTPLSETVHVDLSREVAYSIMSYLNAEDVGASRRARLNQLVSHALGHMDQWFVSRSAPYVRPFMVGLTSHALIMYHERTGDSRVLPAVKRAMDNLWSNMWLPAHEAFKYTDRNHSSGGQQPEADLNMLIAPAYAWLFYQTGDIKYRDRADQIFAGGVKKAWLNNGKQFNQSYRWSFDYIKWRSAKPLR